MQKYTAIDLSSQEIKRTTKDSIVCFFIINKPHAKEFIEQIAVEFLEDGAYYHFYGKYESDWHWIFDDVGVTRHLDLAESEYDVSYTCDCDDLDDLAFEITHNCMFGGNDETEVLLFYDDEEEYLKLLRLLKGTAKPKIIGSNKQRKSGSLIILF